MALHTQSNLPSSQTIPQLGISAGSLQDTLDDIANFFGLLNLYEVKVLYQWQNIRMVNTLWYGASVPLPFMDGAQAISTSLYTVLRPPLQNLIPSDCFIDGVTVSKYTTQFDQTAAPYFFTWGSTGALGSSNSATTRTAVRIEFACREADTLLGSIQQWFKLLPTRGRIYIPLAGSVVVKGEQVQTQLYNVLDVANNVANVLDADLTTPAGIFKPLRVKSLIWDPLGSAARGIRLYTGYSTIQTAYAHPEVAYLSRRQS